MRRDGLALKQYRFNAREIFVLKPAPTRNYLADLRSKSGRNRVEIRCKSGPGGGVGARGVGPAGRGPVAPRKVSTLIGRLILIHLQCWEVLPFLQFSTSGVYKTIQAPQGTEFLCTAGAERQKGQHLPALDWTFRNPCP